ncbi:MAG: outer membrane protein assembly factor BamA [Desulfobacterales bacterium]|nr:outer membrane protein assembly factor BamA [Desulfobacterales bacterium]
MSIVIIFFAFLLLSQTSFASEQRIISKININITSVEDKAPWREMAKKLLYIEEGQSFSQNQWEISLKALKDSRQFEGINADIKEGENGKEITLTLKPAKWIEDIRVSGYYPMFEQEVLNAMGIYVGDNYDAEKVATQKDLITSLLESEGFISPKVNIEIEEQSDSNSVILHIQVSKNACYYLKSLTFTGNLIVSESTLKRKMKCWRKTYLIGIYDRFIEKNLKADLITLRDYYRTLGYAEAVLTPAIDINHDTGEVTIIIDVQTGPKYEISFRGNDAISNRTLKEDVVIFDIGNRFDYGIRRSLQQIRARYQEEGYAFASVKVNELPSEIPDEKTRHMEFEITEGTRVRITSISFTGNKKFDNKTLLSYMQSKANGGLLRDDRFDTKKLDDDLRIIKALYFKEGFLGTSLDYNITYNDLKDEATVLIGIVEGVQTMVSEVVFDGNSVLGDLECMDVIQMKPGSLYQKSVLSGDQKKLISLISEKGYPYVRVADKVEFNENNTEARIVYQITEGKNARIGQVIYNGNFKTQKRILERNLGIETGDPFILSKVIEGQRNLQSVGALNTAHVEPVGLEDGAEIIHLVVDVKEKKPYSVSLGGGYESDKGFFVEAGGSNSNLLGLNKTLNATAEYSQIGYVGEMSIIEPRFLGTKTFASLSIFGEEIQEFNQEFGTRSYGVSSGLTRKLRSNIATGLGLKYEHRETFVDDIYEWELQNPELVDEEGSRSIFTVSPYITFDGRNSPIRPQQGYYTNVLADLSKGIDNSLDDFIKYGLDLRYYYTPVRHLTFALTSQNYHINTYGSGVLSPDQLLYLGGTGSVRGFAENLLKYDTDGNAVGGRFTTFSSVEARYEIGWNIETAFFFDAGAVTDHIKEVNSDEIRTSVGVGLRYVSPIGPVGILYGHKLDPREGESSGRFHFSIGYSF